MIAFCDYAHHPNEIKSLFSTLDLEKTLVVFQPHTFSRTAYLMDDFVDVLKRAKSLIIYKTYPAREKYLKKGSAKSLYLRLIPKCENKVYYAPDMKSLKEQIESFKDKEKVVFVGAGDIYQVGVKIANKI
jgi:UDP-N-acetylmuramate--alanine ligase